MEYQNWEIVSSGTRGVSLRDKGFGGFAGLTKYARRYLAEAAWRFNRRFHLASMLPRLIHATLLCKPCPEPRLRDETNFIG